MTIQVVALRRPTSLATFAHGREHSGRVQIWAAGGFDIKIFPPMKAKSPVDLLWRKAPDGKVARVSVKLELGETCHTWAQHA